MRQARAPLLAAPPCRQNIKLEVFPASTNARRFCLGLVDKGAPFPTHLTPTQPPTQPPLDAKPDVSRPPLARQRPCAGTHDVAPAPDGGVWWCSLAGSFIAHIDRKTGESRMVKPRTQGQGTPRSVRQRPLDTAPVPGSRAAGKRDQVYFGDQDRVNVAFAQALQVSGRTRSPPVLLVPFVRQALIWL